MLPGLREAWLRVGDETFKRSVFKLNRDPVFAFLDSGTARVLHRAGFHFPVFDATAHTWPAPMSGPASTQVFES